MILLIKMLKGISWIEKDPTKSRKKIEQKKQRGTSMMQCCYRPKLIDDPLESEF